MSAEYRVWCAMRWRCKDRARKDYRGRGITVCDRWLSSFENFLVDMGARPSQEHSLDRIDNDKGYEPANCRWADRRTQNNNTRRTVWLDYRGRRQQLTEWASELGINPQRIRNRLSRGWPVEKALETK